MVRFTGHAYPWDVLGDASFPARVRDAGLTRVSLAAAYHAVRAATPLHPDHQIVDARWAALYRPVGSAWAGRRLVPREADWVAERDPFATAAALLVDAGIDVDAWIVLDHNSRLGTENPDEAVVNCFGDRYPYALCPRRPAVREYSALLAREAVRDSPARGVTLEAWGQLGIVHGGRHEKTAGAFAAETARLLSVCCCSACRSAWSTAGADPDGIVSALRGAVRGLQTGEGGPGVDDAVQELLVETRIAATAASLDGVLDALPRELEVSVFGGVDPWAGASIRGISDTAMERIGTVIQGAWGTSPSTADVVRGLRGALPERVDVAAYLTVLPPAEHADVLEHARRVREAGAAALNLYHLGLAGETRRSWVREIVLG